MPLWLSLPVAVGLVLGLGSLLSSKKAGAVSSTSSAGIVKEVDVDGRRYVVWRLDPLTTVVRKDKPHVFAIFKGDELAASGPETDDDMVELGIDLDTIAQQVGSTLRS